MNQTTIIKYYISLSGSNPVKDFINSLSPKQRVKVLRIFMHIQEYGLGASIPHIKKLMGTPLWEIRILGQDNIRILFAPIGQNVILLLHGFIKKSQKTPPKDQETATNRLKEHLEV